MTTPRELADVALRLAREHIERSRAEVAVLADGDRRLIADALKLLHEDGPSSAEHVAYTLLREAMLDLRTAQ